LDDLVEAVVVAATQRLDGPFNVAPDGWMSTEVLRELSGPRPQVLVPAWLADPLTASRLTRLGAPTELAPYLQHPWVVASDRLRAAGWAPTDTAEEAFVAAYGAGTLGTLDARRRQQLSLGAVGMAVAAVAAATLIALARRRQRRSARAG
jgi:hypothetical protein